MALACSLIVRAVSPRACLSRFYLTSGASALGESPLGKVAAPCHGCRLLLGLNLGSALGPACDDCHSCHDQTCQRALTGKKTAV